MYTLVLFLLLPLTVLEVKSASLSEIGSDVPNSNFPGFQPFIVGGVEAGRHEFPWIVHMAIWKDSGNYLCGGALIGMDKILTAAHCVENANASNIVITAGDHDRRVFDGTEQRLRAKSVRIHKDYNNKTFLHDIAVIEMEEEFVHTEAVSSIQLPTPDAIINLTSSSSGTVAGWGTIGFGDPLSHVLLKVEIPIVTNQDCTNLIGDEGSQFCAGEAGKDSCQGDSGGPFMCHDLPGQICGIVSYGFECARPNHPGVYTKINSYVDWINGPTDDLTSTTIGSTLPTDDGTSITSEANSTTVRTSTPSSACNFHFSRYVLPLIVTSIIHPMCR